MRKKLVTKLLPITLITALILSFGAIYFVQPTQAATCNWTGGSANWNASSANWSCGNIPTADDDVTINSTVTVTLTGSTTINSLTLGNSGGTTSPTLNFGYDAVSSGSLTVDDGNMTVYSNANITHTQASNSTVVGRIHIDVESGDITINGTINASNKGYPGGSGGNQTGYGPGGGGGVSANSYGGGGGGHGGAGGNGYLGGSGGSINGLLAIPANLGSGGGDNNSSSYGGRGGGTVHLTGSNITIDGSITANAGNGSGDKYGGGAGGSIYVNASGELSGSGTVSANASNGGTDKGGGGGGGKIDYRYGSKGVGFAISFSVNAGTGSSSGGKGTLLDTNNSTNTLTVASTQTWKPSSTTYFETYFPTIEHVVFINGITLTLQSGNTTTASSGYGWAMELTSLTLNSGSTISMSGTGYLGGYHKSYNGYGPGGGQSGSINNGSAGGGGHGGAGGSGTHGSGGGTYGSQTEPTTIGSGSGGSYYNKTGRAGGGALKIEATGTITVSGNITANGQNAQTGSHPNGGAAGGSIFLKGDTLTGGGSITANGGNGSTVNTASGNGGGGRIALVYISSNALSGTITANKGSGGSGGANGTVYTHQIQAGYITNLDTSLDVVLSSTWSTDLEQQTNEQTGTVSIGIEDSANGYPLASFNEFFDGNRNFSVLSGDSSFNKAYFHASTGFSNIPGVDSSSYTLYVPKRGGTRVGICPGASSLSQVNNTCGSLVYYTESDSNVEVVRIDGQQYWAVSGLTSTGGFSSIDNMTDTMSRLQVSIASDHEIEFTTLDGIDANTDTITVEFDASGQNFNLGSITLSDIDFEDDGTDVTLAASAAAGTWGVNINTTTDIITFTAPTDAGSGEVADDSVITIKIGTNADGGSNQIVNPATAGEYEIEVRMNTANDEYGFVEIAIVDDDTININSYIDSFILFDIDTSDTDEDCDATGGTSPCDSHSGTTDDSGYTVDLGEMSILTINESGDTVTHADSLSGDINYIFFDLSTNASSGAAVTLISANGALNGSGANTIPSVTNDGDGVTISAGDGAYGIREVSNTATTGSFTIAGDYDGAAGIYGECTTSATQIFSTTSAPIDTGRLQMAIGASPDSADGTGTYTDELTFIVTSTF